MPRLLRGLPALSRLATRPLLPLTRTLTPLTHARPSQPSLLRSFYNSHIRLTSSPSPPHSPSSPQAPQTLSGRLKALIKSYGWYALGVYVVLSTLDFGVAFAAINLFGADQVSYLATTIKSFFFNFIGRSPQEHTGEQNTNGAPSSGGSEGMYAMLVLAYTIHKTLFLPVRIGLTAAVTPRFVGWLGRRGWAGSEGARRAGREIRDRVRRGSKGSNSPID